MRPKDFLLNYASLFLLFVMTADALDANWGIGPLYARVQLNLLYNVHAVSVLGVVVAAYWMIVKKDGIPVAVFAAFGTASIHELTLAVADSIKAIPSGLDPRYVLYLAVFLFIGFKISKPYHKRVWLVTFVMLMTFFLLEQFLGTGSTTLDQFAPSKDFYNPISNLAEVGTWLAPASLWFLPRLWFYQPSEGSPSQKP